jgi:uncharacterized protein (DUF2249 family)
MPENAIPVTQLTPASNTAASAAPAVPAAWASAPAAGALDVRPLLARGEEPFQAIMAAMATVPPGYVFRVRSSFEPFPLYHVLGRRGFVHWAHQLAPGDWEVLFYQPVQGEDIVAPAPASGPGPVVPTSPGSGPAGAADPAARGGGGAPAPWPAPVRTVTIDVSDLVPPEPMIRILETLEQIGPGEALLVNHVRRPVYLYARLDELGYLHQTRELGPGQVELTILKPAGRPENSA